MKLVFHKASDLEMSPILNDPTADDFNSKLSPHITEFRLRV